MNAEAASVPRLGTFYLYLTQGCNLTCRHCYLAPKFDHDGTQQPTISVELLAGVLDEAAPLGLNSVKLTGGEPLLHPKIGSILDLVQDRGLNLTLETNGVLCTSNLARRIGVFSEAFVSVSLDGADAATHEKIRGQAGSFAKAVQGIQKLVDAGVRTQIIMSLMKNNVSQVALMIDLAESLGVGSVKFNTVQPMKRGQRLYEHDDALEIYEIIDLCHLINRDLAPQTKLSLLTHIPPAFRLFSSLESGHLGRCNIFGILGLLPTGEYALCGIGNIAPDLTFGFAREVRLSEVWASHPVLTDLRQGLPKRLTGVCGRCIMQEMCLGACIAQNGYQGRDLFAPFWFCEQAEVRGLFPASRLKPQRRPYSRKET